MIFFFCIIHIILILCFFKRTPKHGNNIERNLSVVSEPANTRGFEMMQAEEATKSAATGANLIESEKLEIGGVKWDVYTYYAKSIGWLFSIGTFVLYGVYQGFSLGSNIWLSSWSTDPLAIGTFLIINYGLINVGLITN